MPIRTPTLIEPAGPRSPTDSFRFAFGPASDVPTAWDVQVSTDRTFGTVTHWNAANQTGGISGRSVVAPYTGTGLVAGYYYYWRARGRSGGATGYWSRIRRFSTDAAAVIAPYDSWARTLMAAMSLPRPLTLLGALLPVGAQVGQLLSLDYMARIRVRDDEHPPSTDRIAEVLGITLHVEADGGWEVTAVTHDVQGPPY